MVDTVREKDAHLVGLSALMTTTLKSMEETIRALHDAKLDCKIMVGGAVLTPEYAKKIGADWWFFAYFLIQLSTALTRALPRRPRSLGRSIRAMAQTPAKLNRMMAAVRRPVHRP